MHIVLEGASRPATPFTVKDEITIPCRFVEYDGMMSVWGGPDGQEEPDQLLVIDGGPNGKDVLVWDLRVDSDVTEHNYAWVCRRISVMS